MNEIAFHDKEGTDAPGGADMIIIVRTSVTLNIALQKHVFQPG
jgi:hypothetical protein